MSQYVITAIGTDVGKTFVSAALCHQRPSLRAVKPLLSGFDDAHAAISDAGQLLLAQGLPVDTPQLDAICPWRFTAPLSPHLAAAKERREIDPDALIEWCEAQRKTHPELLIEGVGGLMVPITPDWLVRDWLIALNLPVILVSSSYLGAINHTLLTLQALEAAGLKLASVVVSQSEQAQDAGLADTCDTLRHFLPSGVPLVPLARARAAETPWKDAPNLLSLLV